jgi:hypothetical protein
MLFERVPRDMRLAYPGKILADYADRLFEIADSAELAMKEIASAHTGHLSLAAGNTIGTCALPRILSKFCNSNPGIKVSLFVGNTAQVSQGTVPRLKSPRRLRFLHLKEFGGSTVTHFDKALTSLRGRSEDQPLRCRTKRRRS